MISGQNALGSIDQTLKQMQRQVEASSENIQQVSDEILKLGREQAENFRELARVRLGGVLSEEIGIEMVNVSHRVDALLSERNAARSELRKKITNLQAGQEKEEAERAELTVRLEHAVEALEEQEAKTQEKLQQQPAYRAQVEKAREAEAVAREAEGKRDDADRNRLEKGASYENDPLFSYLWDRKYGTSEYRANPLARLLDRWVAGLCDYQDGRPNYAMLLAIPKRLDEHAQTVRRIADDEFSRLREMEVEAEKKDSIPVLRDEVEQAEKVLKDADGRIENLEQEGQDLLRQDAEFGGGQDKRFNEAVNALAETLQRENLDALYRRARATPGTGDDEIVRTLYDNDERLAQLQQSLADFKRNQERHLNRLAEFEKMRRDFKRKRYDDPRSGFANQAMLAMVLNQFLQGVASSSDVWSTIKREQRYRKTRTNPGFGNGGFSRGGSPWRSPFPGGGGGRSGSWGGGLGRGGGSSGGGFRTGGGF